MLRYVIMGALSAALGGTAPAWAITAKQKMETCKFGADDQQLAGTERKKFISRCMANEPAGRPKPQPAKSTSEPPAPTR